MAGEAAAAADGWFMAWRVKSRSLAALGMTDLVVGAGGADVAGVWACGVAVARIVGVWWRWRRSARVVCRDEMRRGNGSCPRRFLDELRRQERSFAALRMTDGGW